MTVERHHRYLRRYIKLQPGAPASFTCNGGWHEAIVDLGEFDGEVIRGSAEEKKLAPPRIDERWPLQCDECDYEFTFRDRYHFYTAPVDD